MTYRQKAETLLCQHMQCAERAAASIIEFLDNAGDYAPRVFGALNVPDNVDNWDAEIPDELPKTESQGSTTDQTQICPFCAEIARLHDDHEYYRQRRPSKYENLNVLLDVALVSTDYLHDAYRDETYVTGSVTSHGFSLNFCPVCGRKIAPSEWML